MRILIVNNTKIPALNYGGTERVIWWLGKELVRLGHQLTYLVAAGSHCPFAPVLSYNASLGLEPQIPANMDIVHLNFQINAPLNVPYLITHHGNDSTHRAYDINTVFVSGNHAARHGADAFVYNGLDPDDYGPVDFKAIRQHLLFLGYARRPEKNLKGCQNIARAVGMPLCVVGGRKKFCNPLFSLLGTTYMGFIGAEEKNLALQRSRALLFPVRWHEPFGLALIEALYFGAPVFGTSYGSLPEIISPEVGFLANSRSALCQAVKEILPTLNPKTCHDYVCDRFTAAKMTKNYLLLYAKVLRGEPLNTRTPHTTDLFQQDQLLPFDA